jgi:hypothetical protein
VVAVDFMEEVDFTEAADSVEADFVVEAVSTAHRGSAVIALSDPGSGDQWGRGPVFTGARYLRRAFVQVFEVVSIATSERFMDSRS